MSERNTLVRSLHDISLAAWFGGSLMGAVGLNGAAAAAKDPTERTRLSSIGWAKWTPWQIAAVAVHAVGGVGLMVGNQKRLRTQPGAASATVGKLALTAAAAGVTAYSGVLGAKVAKNSDQGSVGSTEPSPGASQELQSAQRQLKVLQWSIPALTAALLVIGAVQGEQQRTAGALDLGAKGLLEEAKRVLTK